MKLSRAFWFIFWLVTGLLIGTILGNVCSQIPFLQFLTLGQTVSFSPAADLVILKFSLDLRFTLNLAQVVGVLIGMVSYHHFEF